MKIKAFVAIDTNVLISATLSDQGASHKVFELVESKNAVPIFDHRMLNEYYRVLSRALDSSENNKYKKIKESDIYNTLYSIISNGLLINDAYVVEQDKSSVLDGDDLPFFEVKQSSHDLDSRLTTYNMKHFLVKDGILKPHEFINEMNKLEEYCELMEKCCDFKDEYEKAALNAIHNLVATGKYILGSDIVSLAFDEKKKTVNKAFFDKNIFFEAK